MPGDGSHLLITKPILLDIETNNIGSITLMDGGRLVFSPDQEGLVKLSATQVLIKDGGALEIGSEDCRCFGEHILH